MKILPQLAGILDSQCSIRENEGKMGEYQTNCQRYLCSNLKIVGAYLDKC